MPLFRSKKKAAAEAEAAAAAAAEGEGGKKKKLTRAQKEKLEKEVRRAPQRPQRFACASHAPCAQANEPRLRPRQMRANLPERQKVSRRGVFEISGPLQVSRATALPPAAALRGRV